MRGKRSARRRWTWVLREMDRRSVAACVLGACVAIVGCVVWFELTPFESSPTAALDDAFNDSLPLYQLDVRSAPWPEWALLPGLGEGMAKRICEHRERHGGFQSPDDVRQVRGIGPKTWERIRPYLHAAPATSPPLDARRPERASGKGT